MANIIKTISTRIVDEIRKVKFLRLGSDDIQEAAQAEPFGFESNPVKDLVGVYIKTEQIGDPVLVGYINPNPDVEAGESRIFSTDDSGSVVYYLKFKKDGTAEFGGTGNFLVKYNELKAELDKLKVTVNTHTHTGNLGGPTSPLLVANTSDFSLCKHDKIKTE